MLVRSQLLMMLTVVNDAYLALWGQTQGDMPPLLRDALASEDVTERSQSQLIKRSQGKGAESESKSASRKSSKGKKQTFKCAQCGKSSRDGVQLQACARCNVAMYCRRDCQRSHWASHKPECKSVRSHQGL